MPVTRPSLPPAGRGIDDQRFGGVGFGFVRAGLGDAIGLKRVPQTGDAIRPLIPGMVGGVCAGVVSHVAGGIRHFRRNVEDRVRGIWAAALGDRGFEFAHGDVRSLNVLLHRREQRVEVEAVPSVALGFGPWKWLHNPSWNNKSPLTSMAMQSVSGQSGELP